MKLTRTRCLIPCSLLAAFTLGLAPTAQTPVDDQGQATEAAAKISPSKRHAALEKEAEAIYDTWLTGLRAQMAAAEKTGEEVPESAYDVPYGDLLGRFQEAAGDYAGTDDAVPFLAWLFETGSRSDEAAGKQALMTLLDAHHASAELSAIAGSFGYLAHYLDGDEELTKKHLTRIEADNVNQTVKGWAALALRTDLINEAALDSPEYAGAKATLTAYAAGTDDGRLKREINGLIKIKETFGNGMVAPNIEGMDLDGVAFSLQEYKGSVVFLDFWGDW